MTKCKTCGHSSAVHAGWTDSPVGKRCFNGDSGIEEATGVQCDCSGFKHVTGHVSDPTTRSSVLSLALLTNIQAVIQKAERAAYEKALRYAIGPDIDPKWLREGVAQLTDTNNKETK